MRESAVKRGCEEDMRYRIAALLILITTLMLPPCHALGSPLEVMEISEKKVPIIMYHKVSNNKSLLGKFVISVEEFEQDLKFIKGNGYETIFMEDLIEFVYNGRSLPEKPIMLTFDDGNFSIDKYVLPLIEKYDAKIVVSIIGKLTDDFSARTNIEGKYFPHLTWEQINKLIDSNLVEIQNHSYDLHKDIGAKKRKGQSEEAYKDWLVTDLSKLQDRISVMTKQRATTFAYPFGAISPTSDGIIKSMGFCASLSCNGKISTVTVGDRDCLYSLGRFLRPHGKSSEEFFARISDMTEQNKGLVMV